MMPAKLLRSACFVIALLTSIAAGAASVTASVTDAVGNALSDAVVYAVPVSGRAPVRSAPAAQIDQIRREFVPLVSVWQTGTSVTFPNRDNIRHSVYSFSPAKTFELRLYSGTQAPPVVFDKAGLVVIGCNIHDHMIAYALVVDTPWFGKTDAAGRTVLDGLPTGDYELHAWHYRQASPAVISRRYSAKGAGTGEESFRIELKSGK